MYSTLVLPKRPKGIPLLKYSSNPTLILLSTIITISNERILQQKRCKIERLESFKINFHSTWTTNRHHNQSFRCKDYCNCFPKSQMQSSLKWKENHQNPNQSHIRVYYIKIWHSKITHEHLNIYSKKSVFQIFNQFQISIFSSPRE